ncbi:hypothetical protein CRYUN_Cryun09bG0093000 [Craigia yunnanensis]
MEERFCITIGQCTMEERVREAAREGDIEVLYGLIREKADVLREIDQMEFVDTPLHIAAAAGHTEFAMELMNLKPSFAMKLNQDGLSPIHLALQNGKSDTVLSLLTFDENLVRVKGKNGYTPLHYVVMKGDLPVLAKFLEDCPNCIHDVTNRNESALHLAAKNKNLKAFEVLLPWLWSSNYTISQVKRILNVKNRDGDNVLHIAASNSQPKIVRLLTEYTFDMKATNSKNLTALGISQGRNGEDDVECVNILRRAQNLRAFNSTPLHLLEHISDQLVHEIGNMPSDRCNAVLVVTVLILTATYQAILSPPGGTFQADSQPKDNTSSLQIHSGSHNTSIPRWDQLLKRSPSTAGSSVLDTTPFLWFFIPNIAAFYISFILTCFVLANLLSGYFSSALIISLCMLLLCLLVSAVLIISPNSLSLRIMLSYEVYEGDSAKGDTKKYMTKIYDNGFREFQDF